MRTALVPCKRKEQLMSDKEKTPIKDEELDKVSGGVRDEAIIARQPGLPREPKEPFPHPQPL